MVCVPRVEDGAGVVEGGRKTRRKETWDARREEGNK